MELLRLIAHFVLVAPCEKSSIGLQADDSEFLIVLIFDGECDESDVRSQCLPSISGVDDAVYYVVKTTKLPAVGLRPSRQHLATSCAVVFLAGDDTEFQPSSRDSSSVTRNNESFRSGFSGQSFRSQFMSCRKHNRRLSIRRTATIKYTRFIMNKGPKLMTDYSNANMPIVNTFLQGEYRTSARPMA